MNIAWANAYAPFKGWWFELHLIIRPGLIYITIRLFNKRFHWCRSDIERYLSYLKDTP